MSQDPAPQQAEQTERHRESVTVGTRGVFQLPPVKYQVSLYYLGDERVAHDERHRCEFELKDERGEIRRVPHVIRNVVPITDDSEEADRAARPREAQGDPTNPPSDEVFRIVISDNHGRRNADRPPGFRNSQPSVHGVGWSKPEIYESNDWMRDIRPAVPFRVVVRKWRDDQRVDIGDLTGLRVRLELKDPREEFEQNQGRPREFLEGFFQATADRPIGDDNAPPGHGGARGRRETTAHTLRLDAISLIRTAPYVDPPAVATAPSGRAVITHDQLRESGDRNEPGVHRSVALELTAAEDPAHGGRRVGASDFVLEPPPIGGDNYRFLITVTRGEEDVRQTRENGARVLLIDDRFRGIRHPRAYTTGRFVIWRRVKMRLFVLVNHTRIEDIDWEAVRRVYERAFVEVEAPEPANVFTMLRQAWRTTVLDALGLSDGANFDSQFSEDAFRTALYPPEIYEAQILSRGVGDARQTRGTTVTDDFATRAIAMACQAQGITACVRWCCDSGICSACKAKTPTRSSTSWRRSRSWRQIRP